MSSQNFAYRKDLLLVQKLGELYCRKPRADMHAWLWKAGSRLARRKWLRTKGWSKRNVSDLPSAIFPAHSLAGFQVPRPPTGPFQKFPLALGICSNNFPESRGHSSNENEKHRTGTEKPRMRNDIIASISSNLYTQFLHLQVWLNAPTESESYAEDTQKTPKTYDDKLPATTKSMPCIESVFSLNCSDWRFLAVIEPSSLWTCRLGTAGKPNTLSALQSLRIPHHALFAW
ncbi:hypothetical protein DFH06DRAFT_1395555 [Mycena polygramma]|nr:hypothetical protein DFH06DRAFT_1395555 [Mycena polygramma]